MRSSGLPAFAARGLPCGGAISVAAASFALAAATCTVAGCKNGDHAHIATYVRPPVPAGFADQSARGFRIATPSTWRASSRSDTHDDTGVWSLVDPQPAGEFHAN